MSNYQGDQILDLLRQRQYMTVEELSRKFFLSPSSIRRKLNELEARGEIVRTHGGAKIPDENVYVSTFSYRMHQNAAEKKKIARIAAQFIHDGDLIFLDASTSAFFLTEYLGSFKNIKVVTNGIDTVSMLAKRGIPACSTGGTVDENDQSILSGPLTIRAISSFHADVSFFSAQSVRRDGEIYDYSESENFVIQCMMEHSDRKIFLGDCTKFDKGSQYRLCSLSDVDHIVTDRDLSNELEYSYHKAKIVFDTKENDL